jgi:type II secretion system protein D
MKTPIIHRVKFCQATTFLCLCAALICALPNHASAQVRIINGRPVIDNPGGTPPGGDSSSKPDSSGKDSGGPWLPSEPAVSSMLITNADGSVTNADEIQLSFQGANIDMIIQWLAQTTGKTVLKHPQVQCQLTITSSKKVSTREAIVLVYRALAMEGFTAIESGRSILIVPEGKEPRMSPELVTGSITNLPTGRQRLVKVFSLSHIQASELKDRIRIALTDKATVDIDEHANQIIITDYNDNIRIVGELIEALDKDKPEDIAVRVLALKNVSALALAKEIGPLYQKMGGGKSLDVAADERANSLIVLSSQSTFDAIQRLVTSLDTEDAQEKTSETFILKNADATDVAKQLQDLGDSQTSQSRYVIYYSQPSDSTKKKMNVVADRRRNAVIVQAAPSQMESIRKMIKELDAPISDDSLAPKIYQLKYVSAVDIEDVLNELFLKKVQQREYYDYNIGEYSSTRTDQDAGRLYGKVRITSEPYSNAIIVTSNSKENLAVVEDVLNQLDRPSEAGESTLRIGLRFAKASTIANGLNILFAKNGSPALRPGPQQNQTGGNNAAQQQQQQQPSTSSSGFNLEQEAKEEGYYPWLGGQPDNARSTDGRSTSRAVSDLVGRVRTVADQRGNAVIISANVHFFPQILKLISDLDAASDQVSIEARIVEVGTDLMDRLGVRWSPDGTKVFTTDDYDNSLLVHSSGNYQKGFGGTTTVNRPPDGYTSLAQQMVTLQSGVVSGTVNMDVLIQFLKKNTDATVIGAPQITINDNETGKLFVGQQVPVPDTTQVSSVGSQNTTIKYKDVGVVLEVTPHINNSGDVQLKIHAESSTTVPGITVLGGAVFDTRNFRTDLTSKNGQTLVLGGIIQRQSSDIEHKTPFLGDIPVLGWAFKKKDKSTRQVELMVFLRSKIVRTPEEAEELMQDVDKKAPALKKWQEGNQPNPKK